VPEELEEYLDRLRRIWDETGWGESRPGIFEPLDVDVQMSRGHHPTSEAREGGNRGRRFDIGVCVSLAIQAEAPEDVHAPGSEDVPNSLNPDLTSAHVDEIVATSIETHKGKLDSATSRWEIVGDSPGLTLRFGSKTIRIFLG
jgi:hypothetical protein